MLDLPQPVAVVCHDAGAANIVLAELKAHGDTSIRPVMQGPAAALWFSAGRSQSDLFSLTDALSGARSVLSGTGWASDLEHDARRHARSLGLASTAVIDHWVNYEARFERDGQKVLPDQIWVTDAYAFEIATLTFPTCAVQRRPNLYFQNLVATVAAEGPQQPGRVCYLLEPLRYGWDGLQQPGEFEALDFLVANAGLLNLGGPLRLRLRPHPSDPPGKYDTWMASQQVDAALDSCPTLAASIAAAEWVAGCETTALAIALAADKRVVATLPPAAPRCRLPHQGLLHLRELAGTSWPAAGPLPPTRR